MDFADFRRQSVIDQSKTTIPDHRLTFLLIVRYEATFLSKVTIH